MLGLQVHLGAATTDVNEVVDVQSHPGADDFHVVGSFPLPIHCSSPQDHKCPDTFGPKGDTFGPEPDTFGPKRDTFRPATEKVSGHGHFWAWDNHGHEKYTMRHS